MRTMWWWRKLATSLALVAAVAGCATTPRPVPTEVTTFDDWQALPAERTYAFGRTLEYRDSLEVKAYEDLVRDALAAHGFRFVPESQANLVVTLRPSATSATVRVRDRWPPDPWWGPYGGFYGPRYPGWYAGAWGGPYGGFYGGGFDDYAVDVRKLRLELDIDSRTIPGKRYYEGRVESTGRIDDLATGMPVLVRALFTDFPGNNGQTRRVDVPVTRVDNPRAETR